MERRRIALAVGALTLLGFLVRVVHLRGSLWVDEMYSVNVAGRSWAGVLADRDQTPPLFVLILHAWMAVAGSSDVAVRIPSLAAGVATVPLVYAIARRTVPVRSALATTTLAALALYPIILSQEARAYSILTLASTAAAWLLLRWEECRTAARAAAYVAVAAAMLYSHVYAVFILAAHAAYLGLQRRSVRLRDSALLLGCVTLLFSAWLPRLASSTGRVAGHFWIQAPKPIDALWTAYILAGGWLPLAFLAGLAIWMGVRLLRTRTAAVRPPAVAKGAPGRQGPRPALLVVLWLVVPLVVPVAISFRYPIFTPRYMAPLAIPALVALVAWIETMPRPVVLRRAAIVCAALSVTASAAFGTLEDSRQDWTGTVHLIESNSPGQAVVLFNSGYCDSASSIDLSCSYERYATRSDIRLVPFFFEDRGSSEPVNQTTVLRLDPVVANTSQAWVVYTYPGDADHLIPQRLETLGFHKAGITQLRRIEVWEYTRTDANPLTPAP